ncbi:MAG: TetR/AcrR family transcriptional regulator [Solirubrobacteraceae bacterium]|nr:TetR/AcrR family transcriptional regulator [Solirubrobacteraceae bacterium]
MTGGEQPPVPQRTDVEERILDAAEEAFLTTLRDAVKITEVADRAGVSVGMIYLRFGSKHGLWAAVRERIHIDFIEFTLPPAPADDELTFDHVMDYCRRWERAFQGDTERARILGALDVIDKDEFMAATNDQIRLRVSLAVAEFGRRIEVLAARGLVRPCRPYETAGVICASIWGAGLLLLQSAATTAAKPEEMGSLFESVRMLVANALLPVQSLAPDGTAPAESWAGGVMRDGQPQR